MRDGHWRWTTARVRSWRAARVEPRGPTSMPRSLSSPVAAISTVSSSRRRLSTVASTPYSASRPARKFRPISPCSSSVIPSAMSTVSLPSVPSVPLDGAFAWDGCRVEPFCDPSSRISVPAAVAPAVPWRPGSGCGGDGPSGWSPCPARGRGQTSPNPRRGCCGRTSRCRRCRTWMPSARWRFRWRRSPGRCPRTSSSTSRRSRCAGARPGGSGRPGGSVPAWAGHRPDGPGPAPGPRPGRGRRGPSWAR